jgi:hypothetical protein
MTYGAWNEKLVDHVFGNRGDNSPVTRIPATPEELCLVRGSCSTSVANLARHEVDAVVADFIGCLKAELAKERMALLRYCLHYREDFKWWSPGDDQQPYFFAMLWFTCLIAYGYPTDTDGDFHARMRSVLGATSNLQDNALGGLDDVWEDLARWTREQREQQRELVLPPRCPWRTNIGRSHFLAFPNRGDREKLATVLEEARLVGNEPPVRLVIEALLASRSRFSREFRDDLDALFAVYLKQGRDPKDSPFWRAIRQQARDLSLAGTSQVKQTGAIGLLAEWDEDDLLMPFMAFSDDWFPPTDWDVQALELRIAGLSRRANLEPSQMAQLLANPADYLRGSEMRAVEEGVVPLLEEVSGLYRVAVAEELASCERALVRGDRTEAMQEAFGGRREESGVPGWILLTGARLEQRDGLVGELSGVTTLLQTTDAPVPTMLGGIRLSGNTFYALPNYLPMVAARGASKVVLTVDAEEEDCERALDDPDHWRLPRNLIERHVTAADQDFELRAVYEVDICGARVTRVARSHIRLQRPVLATEYKGLPAGSFLVETCSSQGQTLVGPSASLPLGFTTGADDRSLDVLPFEPTARWLGPGLGEMSLTPRHDFPWLAVGPKKRPEYLVLRTDNPESAPMPSDGFSPLKGDRRHWGHAFSQAIRTVWKHGDAYVPQEQWPPSATALLRTYRARARQAEGTVKVPETHLDTQLREEPWGIASTDSTRESVHDVLAALFHNRAGLPLREVHEHIARVLDLGSAHLLREQLVRALAESGVVDSLRCSDGRQSLVVARMPRLVAHRRGADWVAVLVGLVPSPVRREFREAAKRLPGVAVDERRTSSQDLPGLLRITAVDREQLVQLSDALGLQAPEYLDWPDVDRLPAAFQVAGSLRSDPVPDMYERDAAWCWESRSFRRAMAGDEDVQVERRHDGRRVPIYVVRRRGEVLGWSYYRTWALLAAYEVSSQPFLKEEPGGVFVVAGHSPLHLPLPLGRLCAVVGLGAPGPRVAMDSRTQVDAYCYPFGSQLRRLLLPFIPRSWIAS